jgi:hypothetical protein
MAKRHSSIKSTPVAVTPYTAVVAEINLMRMEWDCQLFAIRSYNQDVITESMFHETKSTADSRIARCARLSNYSPFFNSIIFHRA